MDTTRMEYTAEDLIAHKLLRAGILVAKPKFDRDGADLLAFVNVGDGAKFCRIQCKGRSLLKQNHSQVSIPSDYVSDAFILFLFVETSETDKTHLFCFFRKDITGWNKSSDGKQFVLNISETRLETEFAAFNFNQTKIDEINKAIISVGNLQGEFKRIISGHLSVTLEDATLDSQAGIQKVEKH